VALVRNDVFEDSIVSIIRMKRISKLDTVNVVPSSLILFTLMLDAIRFREKSFLTRDTRHHVPEDDILHSHRRENFKSYKKIVLLKREFEMT
jgi:hypothetical protein